jgi:hypothetical protein
MNLQKLIKSACEDSGLAEFYNAYSGRGMYGKQCVGITGDKSQCMQVLAEVIKASKDEVAIDDGVLTFEEIVDTLMEFEQDSMGRSDVIIYWRTLPPIEETEPERDGQPDEAQEWHDFDPDC